MFLRKTVIVENTIENYFQELIFSEKTNYNSSP